MTPRVNVDPENCVSSGACVADASGAFEFDDSGVAIPTAAATELSLTQLRDIAGLCPVEAIAVSDD